jgi:hypothetical protein
MKTWGSEGIAPPFLTSALDGGEWLASSPCRFTPGTHWIGDPRAEICSRQNVWYIYTINKLCRRKDIIIKSISQILLELSNYEWECSTRGRIESLYRI